MRRAATACAAIGVMVASACGRSTCGALPVWLRGTNATAPPTPPPPSGLAEDLRSRPAFHAAAERAVAGAPSASFVPQMRDAYARFESIGEGGAAQGERRGSLICLVSVQNTTPWDPGRWSGDRQRADITVALRLATLGAVDIFLPDDLDVVTISVPDVELTTGDAVSMSLYDRDLVSRDLMATVSFTWQNGVTNGASSGPAHVQCRMLSRADSERYARNALVTVDEELTRVSERDVDLQDDRSIAPGATASQHAAVRDAASYVGYADPIVAATLAKLRSIDEGYDDAVARAVAHALPGLPAQGEPVPLGENVSVRVASMVCAGADVSGAPLCMLSVEETHREIPDPPGFDAGATVRVFGTRGDGFTCSRELGADSAFIETTSPVMVRHSCVARSAASPPTSPFVVVLAYDQERALAALR